MAIDKVTRATPIGLSFDPIVVDLGDGHTWGFNPDPTPAEYNVLQSALVQFDGIDGKQDTTDAFQAVSDALRSLLTDSQKDWDKRAYGIRALPEIARQYVEGLAGFPTK